MNPDPLAVHTVQLLARGHDLYAGEPDLVDTSGNLLTRTTQATTLSEPTMSAPATGRLAASLRQAGAIDRHIAAALVHAGADHRRARHATGSLLHDAHSDPMPAADTTLGRREALRRMAARLRAQRRHIQRSHRHAGRLARRLRRLGYRHRSTPRPAALSAVRYERHPWPANRTRQYINAALDHLGITDRAARRSWLYGYQTLITRESGGRPTAVAAEPATEPGARQPDGHRLGYARGITQTIPATFARYHQAGTSTNIYDPVANICASMNYVMHRYGVTPNGANLVALVQQADARRPPKGY